MKTVPELQQEIQTLQNQIGEIQKNCSHPAYEVVMYSWRPGAHYPSRVCDVCQALISGLTEEESKNCWTDFYKSNPIYSGAINESKD
jgi:hypothetical protein